MKWLGNDPIKKNEARSKHNKINNILGKLLILAVFLVFLNLSLISCGNNSDENQSIYNDININTNDDSKNNDSNDVDDKSSEDDEKPVITYTEIRKNGITAVIDSQNGMVTQVKSDKQTIDLDGIIIDVGIHGAYQFGQLGYTSFEELSTWELPIVWPKMNNPMLTYDVDGIDETDNGFIVTITKNSLTISYHYEMLDSALKLSATITTSQKAQQIVNGVGFMVKGIDGFDKQYSTVEFPGSTPAGKIATYKYPKYSMISTDYASPIIQYNEDDTYLNVLFVNEQEKWSSASYSDENDKQCSIFLSAVEGYLKEGDEMVVGNLYLQLLDPVEDHYLAIQNLWDALGYHVPENSINDGPVYSAHPYGTMDTSYFNRLTLQEYAEKLDRIATMGFKNVWLLPIFQHTGDNVYEPIDQGVIDKRYGGEEGAKAFIDKAHQLDLRVLFDLVPHGPRPIYAFAKDHDDWVSKKRNGENQIEWECVSFDYNNPGYYDYTVDLLAYYASEFGLDGARIDCSMGGLSNWEPVEGLRPSSSGLAAGLNITKATREGFFKGGVNPILLPENFHPIPTFAQYTDVFYDMPLFRAMHDFNHSNLSEVEYVKQLSNWLEAEHKTSVKGQVKLRFLGNHDTVTWTFDAERPQTLYGTEKAKALWSLLSFIDGVPFIYQGDEDPATYNLQGENLEAFFTDILSAREKHLPAHYNISYQYTDSAIFAFTRYNEDSSDVKLVLVNLSSSSNTYDLGEDEQNVLYHNGAYAIDQKTISLDPYSTVIIQQ